MTTKAVCNLDSTDMTPDHWLLLARTIREEYEQYDGFVICHGTDTLAYTAAALPTSYRILLSPSSSPARKSPSAKRSPMRRPISETVFCTRRTACPAACRLSLTEKSLPAQEPKRPRLSATRLLPVSIFLSWQPSMTEESSATCRRKKQTTGGFLRQAQSQSLLAEADARNLADASF